MNLSSSYISSDGITQANIEFYREYGYLVGNDMLSKTEVDELKEETTQIFRGKRGELNGLVQVSQSESDADVLKKYVAIHFPHKISTVITKYLFHKRIVDVLKKIVSPNVKCMQSMLFVKASGKAGQSWHQDEFYIPTRDKSLVGAWIAVDDATVENGCLWIIPGSQKPGYIFKREPNYSSEYADVDTINIENFQEMGSFAIEVKSGSIVFFNGYVLHSSLRNKTQDSFRTALVNHYMSAESMLPWDQDGKLPSTEDLRDIILIAGDDPYNYKGIVDINKPYLRPEVLKIKSDV
ncbi:MAG: phytanoyl-CoA dioxygenase family protein [Sphingobacteriaceae bacterium]|nr:MAG: phytanoyl-CoA dioxygenase family protein [Sphingobacteriaceae bacterium]